MAQKFDVWVKMPGPQWVHFGSWGFPKSESQISPSLVQFRKEEPRKTAQRCDEPNVDLRNAPFPTLARRVSEKLSWFQRSRFLVAAKSLIGNVLYQQ